MSFQPPPPLNIKCTDSDCETERHCFKATRVMARQDRGKCRACNADLVDWQRIHKRNINDSIHTFEMLELELIRHHFFHLEVDEAAVRHAARKGRGGLRAATRTRLDKYLAPATPARDGRQTPFSGNAIFYAQHATATCCRTCLEYWHGIPKGRGLIEEEIDYCQQLIEHFFDRRLTAIREEGVKVPAQRSPRGQSRT